VTGGFGQPHIPRNDSCENLRSRKSRRSDITWVERLVRSSNMVRRKPSTVKLGFMVRRTRTSVSQSSETPLQSEVFALNQYKYGVSCRERIQRQQPQTRRTIDQYVVEVLRKGLKQRL
jgi:hypothetical protein